ncbi:energy-coupling factor transporter transmembrane protein EcfT [bacterium BMS3Abin10]|nr:energy-coupling factor transporter transmembrane protein EcfT [bacterium BMS3Abin10]GBE39392.1 energy-coupling factor transporter transmembrane protein EcfT [bacterium BMS3Bbin08]
MTIFSPPAKIFLYILLIILAFLSGSLTTDLALLALVFVPALRVPLSTLSRGIIPITLFLTFTFFSNVLFQTGRVVYEVPGITITDEGLRQGGHLTLRLFILIIGAKALTASTSAEDLVKGMTVLLGPVGRLRPVKEFIYTMSITLRFLPIIYDEAQVLYREGVQNFSKKARLLDKIKISVSLITPLFERSLKKAKQLQSEERGFEL